MGQVHHGSATTTAAVRRAMQHSQESLRALAKRYGINQKTVAKWKGRTSVADVPTGPKNPTSTVRTIGDSAVIVAFRQHILLPLDDCLYALQQTIPSLTRSSLHRCTWSASTNSPGGAITDTARSSVTSNAADRSSRSLTESRRHRKPGFAIRR